MKNTGWAALAALFLLLTGVASAAYPVGNILTVTVLKDGTAQQGILVQFVLNGGTPVLTITDSQGKVNFIPKNPGNLTIQVSTMGPPSISLASRQVSVAAGGNEGPDLIITLPTSPGPTPTPTPPSAGTGGGGGGSVMTSEPLSNIAKSEQHDQDLRANSQVTYNFVSPELRIYEIVVTGKVNEVDINLKVEALKGASKLAATPAPGIVYQNLNILAGTKQIKDVLIRFKVENAWMSGNNLVSGDIRLVRYDGTKWEPLPTSETKKDGTHTYFEARTDSLSLFAITGMKAAASAAPPAAVATIPPRKEETKATSTPGGSTPGFEAIIAVAAFLALYMLWLKRR